MTSMTSAIPLPTPDGVRRGQSYASILDKLSEMSVRKAHDPFLDVPWSASESALEAGDPRLCLDPRQPLAQTPWHQQLDPARRAAFGAAWQAQTLKFGIGFEAVLSRGLLLFAQTLGNRSPDFRYVMHEVIEESRHSQMFQELIDRIGEDPTPVSAVARFFDDRIVASARHFPELFFLAVLGGEIFIDRQNRDELRRPRHEVHPLIRRVMQIHVTEEARHVCFAENYLREHLPRLGPKKRAALELLTPLVLAEPGRLMLRPSPQLIARFAIPRATLREAFGPGSTHRAALESTVEPVRQLAEAHGFWWPAAWRHFGLASESPRPQL
jgi:hypothetical protein